MLGVVATAVCVVSHAAAFSSGTTRRRRILDAASPSCTCTVGGGRSRSASASACAGSSIRPGCYLSPLGRNSDKSAARHVLKLFGVGHSAEPLAATELSSHRSASDSWSAASSHAKWSTCNDDGAALLRQEATKNTVDETKSAILFSEVTFTAFILAAVAFCNPAMSSLAWAADDGTAAPNGGSAPPPVASAATTTTSTAKSGYDAASAGMGMGIGDWSGTGAGGTMQWVPEPVMPPASTSTEKGIGETAGSIDSRSNQEEKETIVRSADNLTPPTNEAAKETRRIDNVERAEPTIDEYGLEITETDTRNSQEKQESSKSSSSPLASNDEAADNANDASALDAAISNGHSTADASKEMTGASTATPPTKPFDYQAAADDLFATTPNIPPSIAETNTNRNKPFDDSRFAMDKEDEEVVEELSFRLYDGRSK